jgi:hypothetical protein
MGDILMFFEQGYNLYLEAVQAKKVYKLRKSQCAPWGELELKVRVNFKNIIININYKSKLQRYHKW